LVLGEYFPEVPIRGVLSCPPAFTLQAKHFKLHVNMILKYVSCLSIDYQRSGCPSNRGNTLHPLTADDNLQSAPVAPIAVSSSAAGSGLSTGQYEGNRRSIACCSCGCNWGHEEWVKHRYGPGTKDSLYEILWSRERFLVSSDYFPMSSKQAPEPRGNPCASSGKVRVHGMPGMFSGGLLLCVESLITHDSSRLYRQIGCR